MNLERIEQALREGPVPLADVPADRRVHPAVDGEDAEVGLPRGGALGVCTSAKSVFARMVCGWFGISDCSSVTVSEPLIAENSFACTMQLDVTMKGRGRMTMRELCSSATLVRRTWL